MTKMLRRVAKNKNSEGKKCAQKSRKSRAALSAKACLEASSWRQRNPADPLYVSINISSKHFSHTGFIGHVKDALEESAVDPQCITIELTESLAMNDVAATGQTMSQLRTLGVKLSIDDFGTGYSSLSYLRRFPVDTLKIDQSFVKTMDAENYAIIKTIVGLARNLFPRHCSSVFADSARPCDSPPLRLACDGGKRRRASLD